jgi:hypothetical protein
MMNIHVSSGPSLVEVMLWGGTLCEDLVYEVTKVIFNHVDKVLPFN